PVTQGIVTRFVAEHGALAVAAFGVGSRVDSLASVGLAAMSTAIVAFTAQNAGAGRPGRLAEGHRYARRFCLIRGGAAALLLAAGVPLWARLFSDEPEVRTRVAHYAWLVSPSLAAVGYGLVGAAFLQGMRRSWSALAMVVTRVAVLVVPGVWIGGLVFGGAGTFAGLGIAQWLGGGLTALWIRRELTASGAPATR